MTKISHSGNEQIAAVTGGFSLIIASMKSIRFTEKSIPALFALLTLLAYGLLLPSTGFYWDDWSFAWIAKFLGPREFIPAFMPFRPFLGPIFLATTSLIPPVPLYWQVFALIIRFIIGLSAWWMFKQIWPERPRIALAVSLLILVFPGYSQHWVAFTHINQELIPFIFYLLSFGFTFKALRAERPLPYAIIALLLQICGIFPTEYFFTIEALRFLFLFFHFQDDLWVRFTKALKVWWPYLLIWMANAAWLFYYYKFGAYNSYGIAIDNTTPAATLSLSAIPDVLFKIGFYAWVQILLLVSQTITTPSTLGTLALIVLTFVLLAFYLPKINFQVIPAKIPHKGNFAIQLIIIGLSGILLGRIPSWVAGLPLNLHSMNDRFTVSMMIGGSLFVLGLIELIRLERAKIYIAALLIALGVGQQFFNANDFRRDWSKQLEVHWQMAWRMPDLQSGTLILTHELPLEYETDFSATAMLNWIYAPDFAPPDLPYALIYTRSRLGGSKLPDLEPGTAMIIPYRTVIFRGDTSASITIYAPTSGCLRVLDPVYANDLVYERYTRFLKESIPLSDPSRIITTDKGMPVMPEDLFGKEPSRTWCYFYEKAELARQAGDWEQVAKLGDKAINQGYAPRDPYEWLPFIEAYALTDDLDKAEKYTRQAFHADAKPGTGLCQLWKRVQVQGVARSEKVSVSTKMIKELQCAP
ncbi:MAG: hypothetical protein MUO77_14475 [Anaerolineales bacterium]|nr:hypothetical protein [Anaerolineales bacterium]